MIDEFSRQCLGLVVERNLASEDVPDCLASLFVEHGIPEHIRSDNGGEFAAKALRGWLGRLGVRTLFIEPGSPWENGYNESFNGRPSDEFLKGEVLFTLKEAHVLIERRREEYNTFRPRGSLGYRPPATELRAFLGEQFGGLGETAFLPSRCCTGQDAPCSTLTG